MFLFDLVWLGSPINGGHDLRIVKPLALISMWSERISWEEDVWIELQRKCGWNAQANELKVTQSWGSRRKIYVQQTLRITLDKKWMEMDL